MKNIIIKPNNKVDVSVDFDAVKTKMCELLSERLRVNVDDINPDKELMSYGVDSIDAVTMVGDLEDWLSVELPSTLLWDYRTIAEVALYIADERKVA